MPSPRIVSIHRYPVKGMTPETLERVALSADETLPFDRAYAIENGPGRFDSAAPKHLPKINFLMLMRDEKLASIEAHFDDAAQLLTLSRGGRQVARGDLSTPLGRRMVEQFLGAYMQGSLRGAPRIVSAPDHSFSDVAAKCVHIITLASLRDLERVHGVSIDALRFRPNIVIDGVAPWAEFDWIGKQLTVGDATLSVFSRTQRCDAINVDPATAVRDASLTAVLQRSFGHADFGVYARVSAGGQIATGQAVEI